VLQLGLGVGLTTPHRKKISLLRKFIRHLGPGQIPWINDLSERKWICDLVHGMLEVCMGQVRSAEELSKIDLREREDGMV
jgi:hypothetical protein